jgi:predicted metal-dependent phosphoesterase TrpH
LIDLHTHTTASDGRLTPPQLVVHAATAGVTVLGVTDHDTLAACDPVRRACAELHIAFVPGIEVTAVENGRDVHVLGYFVEPDAASLQAFLVTQRRQRAERIRAIVDLLRTQ